MLNKKININYLSDDPNQIRATVQYFSWGELKAFNKRWSKLLERRALATVIGGLSKRCGTFSNGAFYDKLCRRRYLGRPKCPKSGDVWESYVTWLIWIHITFKCFHFKRKLSPARRLKNRVAPWRHRFTAPSKTTQLLNFSNSRKPKKNAAKKRQNLRYFSRKTSFA